MKSLKLKKLTVDFIANKKNANNLIELLIYLENDETEVLLRCIRCIQKIFIHLIQINYISSTKKLIDQDKYKLWIQDRFSDTIESLCNKFSHEISAVGDACVNVLMSFIKAKGKESDGSYFDTILLSKIIVNLIQLKSNNQSEELVLKFSDYLIYFDVRYFAMTIILKEQENDLTNNELLFLILKNTHLPRKLKLEEQKNNDSDLLSKNFTLLSNEENKSKLYNLQKEHQKLFSDNWLVFIKKNHSSHLFKLILGCLADKVIPFMNSPLPLADILTSSYNLGGSISLLALNGLFILINDYNLQYNDFYPKLYRLLQPNVLDEKYRSRFFYLLDLFLSSSHLPAYLVSAFIKRLSRLSLKCQTPSILAILTIISNLLSRHPCCQFLINRHNDLENNNLENDPYIEDEMDPLKCNALKSSLWEIQTLQFHYNHTIAMEMKRVNKLIPDQQLPTSHLWQIDFDEMISKERRKKIKSMPINYIAPDGFASGLDENLFTFI